jgi:branched-chain amino acid transport system permease protein
MPAPSSPPGFAVERATRASRTGALAAAALVVVLAALPAWGDASHMRLFTEFACYLVLAQTWNLLAGYGGLVSVGQQAYVGLGGYALVVLANHTRLDPFTCVPIAGLVAAVAAVPTALVVFRLQGGYFAIGTWVVAEVYRLLVANVSAWGGGSGTSLRAMQGIPRSVREPVTFWIALAIAVGSIGLVYWFLRSRHGLALTAIRDSEVASESQGVDVRRTKLGVYLVAAFGGGLAGALYFLSTLRISPDAAFGVNWTAFVIFIVVIGGIGTIEGPIVGTVLFFVLREVFGDLATWYLMALGLLAIAVMVVAPRGLWGLVAARYDVRLFPVQRRIRPAAGGPRRT